MRLQCVLFALFVANAAAYGSYDIDYDQTMAVNLVPYASAAYCPEGKVTSWSGFSADCASATSGFTFSAVFSHSVDDDEITDKAFAYVGVDKTRGWVIGAFKGSNETQDFIDDISGGEFAFGTCEVGANNFGHVHKGFCNYYSGLSDAGFPQAFHSLTEKYPSYTPVITGHSLGAAAAVLAAYDVNIQYGISPVVYTYGQPRVGDYNFSQDYETRVQAAYRVVHRADMVAHLPVCCAVFGACKKATSCPYHTIDEIHYDNDMDVDAGDTYQTCDGGEDKSCEKYIDLSISDHLSYFMMHVGSYCCFSDS